MREESSIYLKACQCQLNGNCKNIEVTRSVYPIFVCSIVQCICVIIAFKYKNTI